MKFAISLCSYLCGLSSLVAFFWFTAFGMEKNPATFQWTTVLGNTILFLVFPLQHSILARPSVQSRMKRFLDPRLIRPFFVGTSGIALWLVVWFWMPLCPVLYRLPFPYLFQGVYLACMVCLIFCTLRLNHSQMFGLKQGYAAWKDIPLEEEKLKTAGIYGVVRHPITSILVIALWAQGTMSVGRLLWNLLFTSYALIGTILEERSLLLVFGDEYRRYREKVPAFIPHFRRQKKHPSTQS